MSCNILQSIIINWGFSWKLYSSHSHRYTNRKRREGDKYWKEDLNYLYIYYMVHALLSHTQYITLSCDITLTCDTWHVMWYFPILLPCIVSSNKKRKEKEKKRNINNNLAVLAISWHWRYIMRWLPKRKLFLVHSSI